MLILFTQLFLILISNRLQKLGIHNSGFIEHRTYGRMSNAYYNQQRDRASTDLREEVEVLHFTVQTGAVGHRRRLLHFCGS
jgi:hypothetical protein